MRKGIPRAGPLTGRLLKDFKSGLAVFFVSGLPLRRWPTLQSAQGGLEKNLLPSSLACLLGVDAYQ